MTTRTQSRVVTRVLEDNPLEGESLLRDALFAPTAMPTRKPAASIPRPQHYKIVSISLYTEDIERLERMVAGLKRRGHFKANKSQLIRYALSRLDINTVPNADRAPALFDSDLDAAAGRR